MKKSNEVGSVPYDKLNNVESSLFQVQGRITRKDFFSRTLFCFLVWLFVHFIFIYWETPNYEEWVIRGGGKIQAGAVEVELRHKAMAILDYYIVPIMLFLFVFIQAVKRVHDCNRSGKYLVVPFYNIYLLFAEGSTDDNDYGLLPHSEILSPSYSNNDS